MNAYKTGTTTVGIVAKDGIVLAADMQATLGHLSSNKEMTKIYKINNHLAVTVAGSVGDALVLVRFLRVQSNLYELEHKKPMNTTACATLLSNILNANKMMPYFTQFILAGSVDRQSLYSLDVAGGLIEEKEVEIILPQMLPKEVEYFKYTFVQNALDVCDYENIKFSQIYSKNKQNNKSKQ